MMFATARRSDGVADVNTFRPVTGDTHMRCFPRRVISHPCLRAVRCTTRKSITVDYAEGMTRTPAGP